MWRPARPASSRCRWPLASKRSGGVWAVLVKLEPVRSALPPSSSGRRFRQHLERVLAGLAAGRGLGLAVSGEGRLVHRALPIGRQLAGHTAGVFGGELGVSRRIGIERFIPLRFGARAGRLAIPVRIDLVGNDEGRVAPAERGTGQRDLVGAERLAVRLGGAAAVGRALADGGPAADQRRPVLRLARLGDRLFDRLHAVAVDALDHLPAIGLEAARRVVGEPGRHRAVDRDAVVVPEGDQLVELPGTGQRTGLVADAFHQAAIAEEGVGVMVDHRVAVAVELGGEQLFGQRHADRVGQALAERAGGRLDAGGDAHLGVAGRLAVQLAEVLQLGQREVVAAQVEQRVLQHRAMAVGEHEAVTPRPVRVGRVVAQVRAPERHRDLGHAHRGAGVAGVGLLHGVHGQGADGVGHEGCALLLGRFNGRSGGGRRAVEGNDRGHAGIRGGEPAILGRSIMERCRGSTSPPICAVAMPAGR